MIQCVVAGATALLMGGQTSVPRRSLAAADAHASAAETVVGQLAS